MNENIDEGRELVQNIAQRWLHETDLVPVALIALEVGEPVEQVAGRLSGEVVLDHLGMGAISVSAAREFFAARAEQTRRIEDQSRRIQEEMERASRPVAIGVPAVEGATPLASLMVAEGASYETPQAEFGGRPAPRFLQEAIEQGAQQAAAARAEAAARKAAREGKDS